MAGRVTDWVSDRIDPTSGIEVIDRTAEDFLVIRYRNNEAFPVAVIGAREVVLTDHVVPVLSRATKPQFVVNVPSKTPWSGPAISIVHAAPAAFGSLGDLARAARSGDVPAYRNKEYAFFERVIGQHSNVSHVTRLYDVVFLAHRFSGNDLTIALVDAYNMSAEDVRNARETYGHFDIALKMTSYGSVTNSAREAAESIGAEALTLREAMRRLAQ